MGLGRGVGGGGSGVGGRAADLGVARSRAVDCIGSCGGSGVAGGIAVGFTDGVV